VRYTLTKLLKDSINNKYKIKYINTSQSDRDDSMEIESSTKSLKFESSSKESAEELEVKFNGFFDFGVLVAIACVICMDVDSPGIHEKSNLYIL